MLDLFIFAARERLSVRRIQENMNISIIFCKKFMNKIFLCKIPKQMCRRIYELFVNKQGKCKKCSPPLPIGAESKGERKNFFEKE